MDISVGLCPSIPQDCGRAGIKGPMKKCPICRYEFKNERGLAQHRARSAFCKYVSFAKMMMEQEEMVEIYSMGKLLEYAKLRRVEIYKDREGRTWVPMWFIQILKEHAKREWKRNTLAPVWEKKGWYTRLAFSPECRRRIVEAKKDRRMQGSLSLKFKMENHTPSTDSWNRHYVGDDRYWVATGEPWDSEAAFEAMSRATRKYGLSRKRA